MNINALYQIYFSPVSHTRIISNIITNEILKNQNFEIKVIDYDITITKKMDMPIILGHSDLVIFGCPVYSGRIPNLALERINSFQGDNTPAIVFVSYGNRAYEDALLELANTIKKRGFKLIAAATCVAEHTITPKIATGRPDNRDIDSIKGFAVNVYNFLSKHEGDFIDDIYIPGNNPYREYSHTALPQFVDNNCIQCGKCASLCPSSAISIENPKNVDIEKCICCMRCVNICPTKARHPDNSFISAIYDMIIEDCSSRKENEYFIC